MNLPNLLTILRLCMVPIFAYYLFVQEYTSALLVFLLAGLTDILDGYLARKFNLITKWGKFADPLADKLIQSTAVIVLTINQVLPLIVFVVLIAKELLMAIGAFLLLSKDKTIVAANWYGKLATIVFYYAIAVIISIKILNIRIVNLDLWINIFVGVAVLSKLFALSMYSLNYFKIKRKLKQDSHVPLSDERA